MPKRDAAWMRREAARERALAQQAISRAELWDRTADEMERLQGGEHSGKVSINMEAAHKVAISSGRRARGDRFTAAINARGYSIRTLATALGIKDPTLHAHRKPKAEPNSRPIPRARAEQIEKLTGWPADAAHWPAGLTG